MTIAPAIVLAASLAMSGADHGSRHDPTEVACLALNIYHEARGESAAGQAAVAHVTLNRVRSGAFPSSVCAVVHQRVGSSCQFGWVCKGLEARDRRALDRALRVALEVLDGRREDPTHGAQYFLAARDGTPSWARRLRETAVIDNHRFFRRS